MKHITLIAISIVVAFTASAAENQTDRRAKPEAGSVEATTPNIYDLSIAPITDEPGLPRVLLIGDSISIGYTLDARANLKGKANVHRIRTNGQSTRVGLLELERKWLRTGKWDVIHFNWGLHDLKYINGKIQVPLPEYEANLENLVQILERTAAKLIWASTTPFPDSELRVPRYMKDLVAYNEAAAKIMAKHHIPIDDLCAAVAPRLGELQRPLDVHFKPEGDAFLGKLVAESISKSLDVHSEKQQ